MERGLRAYKILLLYAPSNHHTCLFGNDKYINYEIILSCTWRDSAPSYYPLLLSIPHWPANNMYWHTFIDSTVLSMKVWGVAEALYVSGSTVCVGVIMCAQYNLRATFAGFTTCGMKIFRQLLVNYCICMTKNRSAIEDLVHICFGSYAETHRISRIIC
jgi:hypothetical protein